MPPLLKRALGLYDRIAGRQRLPFFLDSLLKGGGQVFFSPSPLSGLSLMAGLFVLSVPVGFGALGGLISATAAAWLLGCSPHWIRLGLYGFNGLLAGWFWAYFWPHPLVILLVPATAVGTVPLMAALSRWGGRYGLPALSLPFVLAVWTSLLLLYFFRVFPFSPALTPQLIDPFPLREWPAFVTEGPQAWKWILLVFIAVLLYSRLCAAMFLLGLIFGLLLSFLFGGAQGVYWLGLYAFTAVPLAMSLGGLFFRWGRPAVPLALAAVAAGSLLWYGLSRLLAPLGLYPLTAPFNLIMWLLLSPLSAGLLRRWKVAAVPLAAVSRPEKSRILLPSAAERPADSGRRTGRGGGSISPGKEIGSELILLPLGRPDYLTICRVVDSWFGDPVSYLVHPVYREHFSGTSFVAREGGGMAGFLLGFVSQDRPEVAYAHLVCTDPARRRRGIGRSLYRRFFQAAIQRGCLQVTAITVPLNQTSISFHRSLGFMLRTEGAVREGDYPVMKDFAGPGIDCVVLERSLAEPLL